MSKDFETIEELIEDACCIIEEDHEEGCECYKCRWLKQVYTWLYPDQAKDGS